MTNTSSQSSPQLSQQNVIDAHNVSKAIDAKPILNKVNLSVREGSIHGLVGPNGAGKSTFLRLLNGVYEADAGSVQVFGQALRKDSSAIRQQVHLVSADGGFYPGFRVKDLLRYASLLYANWDNLRAKDLMEALALPLGQPVNKLSLGMKMQLRLAVALSSRPKILLLDEPTNGLDPVVRRQFLGLIVQETAGTGMSVLFATHRLEELEAMADDISILYQGQILLSANVEDFKTAYSEVVAVMKEPVEPSLIPDTGKQSPRQAVDSLSSHANVVAVSPRGKLLSIVVRGDTTEIKRQLVQYGAIHVDQQSVKFEELFRVLMEREGYTRDAILLS